MGSCLSLHNCAASTTFLSSVLCHYNFEPKEHICRLQDFCLPDIQNILQLSPTPGFLGGLQFVPSIFKDLSGYICFRLVSKGSLNKNLKLN